MSAIVNEDVSVDVPKLLFDAMRRIDVLEKAVRRLEGASKSEKTAPIIDRGMAYYAEGDSVPSRGSPAEYYVGKTWLIDGVPLTLMKNDSGRMLKPGEEFKGGKVDSLLRFESVAPNNFFYVEV